MNETNTKGRLLFLEHYLLDNTDEEHPVTTEELIRICEISRLPELSLTETDYTKYDGEFKRLSDEIDAINEQIRAGRGKLTDHSVTTDSVRNLLDELEQTEFGLRNTMTA